MKALKIILILLTTGIYSCGQITAKHKADPAAVDLNKKAMILVPFLKNDDSSQKAISLLDEATAIDSSYFLGYYNKLMFLNQLKKYDKAIHTINILIGMRPLAHDLYMTGGIFYERSGDTVSAKNYFQKSLTICNVILDTMNINNGNYEMVVGNKAVDLIMLNEQAKANEVLKKLYDSQTDEEFKKMILSLMNKNKKELLEYMTGNHF